MALFIFQNLFQEHAKFPGFGFIQTHKAGLVSHIPAAFSRNSKQFLIHGNGNAVTACAADLDRKAHAFLLHLHVDMASIAKLYLQFPVFH